eukprot:gnl/MRDRNA2_/MRDRNA2_31687_c0_seq2.p2 gnl/MRDRNA2_/MRDRNA2_31687_c0~~gnl/MRDRNA2_/MRDRNA2_31687_c0_seq2.p2  ORF type:complete len:167 (+),score=47.66 gnl/MRDRNA2_/MRDRNA2_31687_c0_seq2:136-636(+)
MLERLVPLLAVLNPNLVLAHTIGTKAFSIPKFSSLRLSHGAYPSPHKEYRLSQKGWHRKLLILYGFQFFDIQQKIAKELAAEEAVLKAEETEMKARAAAKAAVAEQRTEAALLEAEAAAERERIAARAAAEAAITGDESAAESAEKLRALAAETRLEVTQLLGEEG